LLDDYLRNKLSGQDKSAFEEVLKNDASLQKELRVQQQVVNSLRNARVTELKQMLNNVPITAIPLETTGVSVLGKIAAFVVVAGLVGGGIYVYNNANRESGDAIGTDSSALTKDSTPADQHISSTTESIQPPVVESDVTNNAAQEDKTTEIAKGANTANHKVTDSVAPAARNVFEPSEESKSSESSSAAADSGKGTAGVVSTPSITVEAGINGNNGKYNFHYQFKDNKLLLYGVFEQNLYELMEFFSNNKRTLFLYYKDKYYLLNEDDSKVKRLSPISDPALLKKLKDYRAAR
jgi:hypothetical protein